MTNELKSILKGIAYSVIAAFTIYGITMAIYFT